MKRHMFKNENHFKKWLTDDLRARGYTVTPIETRTVPGVPDLYAVGRYWGMHWIECKYVRRAFREEDYGKYPEPKIAIPFRTGQQSWAYQQYKQLGTPVICAVAFTNGVYMFDMIKVYEDRMVPHTRFIKYVPHKKKEEE